MPATELKAAIEARPAVTKQLYGIAASILGVSCVRSPPKLVHKILFSMPAGKPPKKVLEAVRDFAREEFALTHRYVMVLHLCGVVVYVEQLR